MSGLGKYLDELDKLLYHIDTLMKKKIADVKSNLNRY